jgi:hypothetical protein
VKIAPIILAVLLAGCASTQTTQFKTISSAQTAVNVAYNGYLDLVEKQQIATNSVPQVSKAFNDFQQAATSAVLIHGLNLTNTPPLDVSNLAASALAAINAAEGH